MCDLWSETVADSDFCMESGMIRRVTELIRARVNIGSYMIRAPVWQVGRRRNPCSNVAHQEAIKREKHTVVMEERAGRNHGLR
jgi:hypothetical protein